MPEILLLWAMSFLPPQRVMVNGEPWKIQMVKQIRGSDYYTGYTYCWERKIELKVDGPEELRDTTIHELLHAMACVDGESHNELYNNSLPGKKHENHPGIYFAAPKLVQLIRNNPQLMAYLEKR